MGRVFYTNTFKEGTRDAHMSSASFVTAQGDMDPVGSGFSLCLRGLAKSITERPQDGSALSQSLCLEDACAGIQADAVDDKTAISKKLSLLRYNVGSPGCQNCF